MASDAPKYPWEPQLADGRRSIGCAVAGWAAFLLLFAAILFFGYRVWFYYDKIRKGEIVDLPQFTGRLTAPSGTSEAAQRLVFNRAETETADAPALGAPADSAVLTIVEFADFECPYSKEEAPIVRQLMAKYGDKVRLIYRDYPLEEIHPAAKQASMAAECAREQGKFWIYHDKLYGNSPAFDIPDLVRYADESGLDIRQFERCLTDGRYRAKVEEDMRAAAQLNLRGTPTFFFNGQKIEGAIPPDIFERLVERLLQ